MKRRPVTSDMLSSTSPYLIFSVLGTFLVVFALVFFLVHAPVLPELLLNLGVSVVAVVVVEYVWRHFGGDPIIQALAKLRTAVRLLNELEAAGLESFSANREEGWDHRRGEWIRKFENASKIDMMGMTLMSQIGRRDDILEAIRRGIDRNGCQVRVITLRGNRQGQDLHPMTKQRVFEEDNIAGEGGSAERIRSSLVRTWQKLLALPPSNVKLKTATKSAIYANLIRADDWIWYSPYLASSTGSKLPSLEVADPESSIFEMLQQEFDRVWNDGSEPNDGWLLPPAQTPPQ